jgi:response regulator RpfG family c-di-GMP phosphodiesterase
VGENEPLLEYLSKKAAGDNMEVVRIEKDGLLPPGAATVVGGAEDADVIGAFATSLGKRQEELLELIGHAIDSREDLAQGSSLRVKNHATRFAHALGLSAADQLILERGALLRDIGKLKIRNEVLLKYTLLTHEEWQTLQRHTHFGGDLVKRTEGLRDIEDIVRRHHECFDGTGYPDGLEADAIPILAQAIRILDVFCAMTSARHYRQSTFTVDEALDHIKSESGKHFHPELAKVFIEGDVAESD